MIMLFKLQSENKNNHKNCNIYVKASITKQGEVIEKKSTKVIFTVDSKFLMI